MKKLKPIKAYVMERDPPSDEPEPVLSGVFIGTPYPVDTPEWDNFLTTLQELNAYNHNSYLIEICDKCKECGAINRTVEEDGLCDGCAERV